MTYWILMNELLRYLMLEIGHRLCIEFDKKLSKPNGREAKRQGMSAKIYG